MPWQVSKIVFLNFRPALDKPKVLAKSKLSLVWPLHMDCVIFGE